MATFKLTDTQLVLLSKASQREDRLIELPATLKGGATRKVVGRLLERGLIEEIGARGAMPVWRREESEGAFALRITRQGMKAIAVDEEAEGEGSAPSRHIGATKVARQKPGNRMSEGKKQVEDAAPPRRMGVRSTSGDRKNPKRKPPPGARQQRPRAETRQAQILAMLERPQGATIVAIMETTGWQQHSVRGFFASTVRNKLGLTLVSERQDGERVYRITGRGSETARSARGAA